MHKKCGRGLKDVTPLLANEAKISSKSSYVTMQWTERNDPTDLIDQTSELLTKAIKGFKPLGREEILAGKVPVELLGVDTSKRPLIIKCATHCGPLFLTESLEALGTFKDSAFSQFTTVKGTNKKLVVKPRLVIVAKAFAPGIHRAFKALAALPLQIFRIVDDSSLTQELPLEKFDFERGEFYPALIDVSIPKPQKTVTKPVLVRKNSLLQGQLTLDLEGELDDTPPFNS